MRKSLLLLLMLLLIFLTACSQVNVANQLNEKYKTNPLDYPENFPESYKKDICQLTEGLKEDCVDTESAVGMYATFRHKQIIADEQYLSVVNNRTKLASEGFRCGDIDDIQQGAVEVNASAEKSREALVYLQQLVNKYPLQSYYLHISSKSVEELNNSYEQRVQNQTREVRIISKFCSNETANIKEIPIKAINPR
ncbi:MAG: hypothetical protein QW331_04335 [Candidatus Woesearchaeota archaeon]